MAFDSTRILNSINPITFWSTAKEIAKWRADVLVMSYWQPLLAPALGGVARLTKKKGIPLISILHNIIPHEEKKLDKALNSFFLRQSGAFIVMSEKVKSDLLLLKPNSNPVLHPHPVYDHFGEIIQREAAREHLKIPKGKKLMLFFGLIRAYKGLDTLLKSLAKLPEDYHLVVAGEPYESMEPYKNLTETLSIQDRVHWFTNFIPDEEVPYFFSAADTCVLPYKTATQSGVLALALHFDLPLLVTDTGGLKELVEPNQLGKVAIPEDYLGMAQQIKEMNAENEVLSYKENIQHFKQKYSWDSFAEKLTELAKTLINGRKE